MHILYLSYLKQESNPRCAFELSENPDGNALLAIIGKQVWIFSFSE